MSAANGWSKNCKRGVRGEGDELTRRQFLPLAGAVFVLPAASRNAAAQNFPSSRTLMKHLLTILLLIAVGTGMFPTASQADDMLKLAVGAPNNWDSGLPDIGKR